MIKKQRDMIFLKGKESVFTNILLLIAVVIFIVPIILIFSLKFIYKLVQKTRERIFETASVENNLNKVY